MDSYCIPALGAFGWAGRVRRCADAARWQVLHEMVSSGRQPTVGTFNGLMAVLAGMASRNQATVEQGYRILQRLQERGLQASCVSCVCVCVCVC